MKKTVALIFGGEGQEREISKKSAENLASFIDRSRYCILPIYIDECGNWFICDGVAGKKKIGTHPIRHRGRGGFYTQKAFIPTDCAIPCLHGDFGEDGVIQGALTASHIPYVGEDVYASALTSDKLYTKSVADTLGIPTARWIASVNESLQDAKKNAEQHIGYPMFIKPARMGSSFGASPCESSQEFDTAYALARKFGDRILIEEKIKVKYELECALLGVSSEIRFIAGGKVCHQNKFYDFETKYNSEQNANVTDKIDSKIKRTAELYAESLSKFIGLQSLSRIDFLISMDNEVFFNEINAFPGMTKTSLYPKMTEHLGCGRGDFINLLIEDAIRRDRSL